VLMPESWAMRVVRCNGISGPGTAGKRLENPGETEIHKP
jgi:hypothetical protein